MFSAENIVRKTVNDLGNKIHRVLCFNVDSAAFSSELIYSLQFFEYI